MSVRNRTPKKTQPAAPGSFVEDAIESILAYYTVIDAPISEQDLIERSRDPYTVKVRAMVMYFLKTECHWSYKAIGARLQRDHAAVINMVRRVRDLVTEGEMVEVFDYVRERAAQQLQERKDELLRGAS